MFDPINGPSNHYQGPATGLGTEAGDTWHAAVSKVNAGFKNVIDAIESWGEKAVEAVDADARKENVELREQIAALQIKFDAADSQIDKLTSACSDYAFKVDAMERAAASKPPTGDALEAEAHKPPT